MLELHGNKHYPLNVRKKTPLFIKIKNKKEEHKSLTQQKYGTRETWKGFTEANKAEIKINNYNYYSLL